MFAVLDPDGVIVRVVELHFRQVRRESVEQRLLDDLLQIMGEG